MTQSREGTNNLDSYQYTNNWFLVDVKKAWDQLIPQINPTRILEIGSYEGASACYLIDTLSKHKSIEIHCVDSWEGGIEHQVGGLAESNMLEVEKRFINNTDLSISKATHKVDIVRHKGYSDKELAKLLTENKQGYF